MMKRRHLIDADMKECQSCFVWQPLSEFYSHPLTKDGYASRCKVCARQWARDRYKITKSARQLYEKSRSNAPNRVAKRKQWLQDNPHKKKAQDTAKYALCTGKIIKTLCEICGNKKVQAHHDDYSKPLKVRWLCSPCHQQFHAEERRSKA